MDSSDEPICGNAYFTNLGGELTNMICDLPPGHEGDHVDHRHGAPVTWEALGADAFSSAEAAEGDGAEV